MNFLIFEGYKDAAIKFIKEAGINIEQIDDLKIDLFDEELIDARLKIRKCILSGQIKEAI